jgi:hypothetical protein
MTAGLPQKIVDQMKNAGLPTSGQHPFVPKVTTNRKGEQIIDKREVTKGARKGKKGYVDVQGRIWVRNMAHAGLPMHWDVEIDGGDTYLNVDLNGNEIK